VTCLTMEVASWRFGICKAELCTRHSKWSCAHLMCVKVHRGCLASVKANTTVHSVLLQNVWSRIVETPCKKGDEHNQFQCD
jgi:hypothetical protein